MIILKVILIILIVFSINYAMKNNFKFYQLAHYNVFSIFSKDFFLNAIIIFANNVFFGLSQFISTNFFVFFALIIVSNFVLIFTHKKEKNEKNKLVFTKRFLRFFVLFNILCLSLLCCLFFFFNSTILAQILIIFYYFFAIFLFIFSHFLLFPVEKLIKFYYIFLAKRKLKKSPKTQIIAISGSYGKTSVKNILFEMLKTTYSVTKTKSSFNTSMGITKTILNDFNTYCDFLILEFGADHKHDIKKLCQNFQPNHSIITGVTNQHLKTFKTMDNIINTKFELARFTQKSGYVVFNGTNDISRIFYDLDTHKNKILIEKRPKKGKKSNLIYAKNIKTSFLETSFTLVYGEREFKTKTKLLGEFNVTNILLCANLALKLGVEIENIVDAITNLSPTENRLKIMKISDNKYILDDSFNSNVVGAFEALKVLKSFYGTKIVVTPGLVELGEKQEEENERLGKNLASFDYVLLTNKINILALKKGMESSKTRENRSNNSCTTTKNTLDNSCTANKNATKNNAIENRKNKSNKNNSTKKNTPKKVYFCENLEDTKEILSKIFIENCCVLFLNDLPDNYK